MPSYILHWQILYQILIKKLKSYNKAKLDLKWIDAMDKKIAALEQNETWELTSLPPHKYVLGCKWVYKAKFNPYGSLERCKARLVGRGDKKIKGKKFKHTFNHVAKFTTGHNCYCSCRCQKLNFRAAWHQ